MNANGGTDQALQDRISIARVVQFFLRWYALQLGAPAGAPTRYTLVSPPLSDTETIYELSVKAGAQFRSRRLAISQLGSQSRSKSFCYKVVFDTPVVIKIPALPIKTFRAYVKSLQSQRLIVDDYDADKRIIAPGVSAFFKCAQVAGNFFAHAPERLETWGVRWLESHPQYHRYLKIGDTFVFLMDLSTHAFLSSVLYQIHDVRADVPQEIVRHPNVLWDFSGFENRYGSENAKVCFSMNGAWNEYEKQVRQALLNARLQPRTIYEIRQWFLAGLADAAPPYPDDLAPDIATAFDQAWGRLQQKYRREITAYRRTVQSYIKRTTFSRNATRIRGLVVSLLDLLAWLDQSRLAIRDLKPDNIFIAGDTERHSYLTAEPEKYYLGLIDIETAIGLDSEPQLQKQPLLGGTPSYATLSQFYPNSVLARVYPDLPRILHLQDWYAVMAMAFEAITGAHLFSQTRKLLFDIRVLSKKMQSELGDPAEAYRGSNYIFWRRAGEEFEHGLSTGRERMRAILVEPTEAARILMARHAAQQLSTSSLNLQATLAKLSGMLSAKRLQQLNGAGLGEIVAFRQHLEKMARVAPHPSEKQANLLELVRRVEGQRRASLALKQGIAALEAPDGKIAADRLLRLLFHTVAIAMETPRPSWGRNPAGATACGTGKPKSPSTDTEVCTDFI